MRRLLEVEALVTQWFGVTNYAQTNLNYARMDPPLPTIRYHEGLDYVPIDREHWGLFAPVGGEITWAGWGDVYGWNLILFDDRTGLSFRWCHLEEAILVKAGDRVKAGDLLGVGGSSGASTARHFHMNCVPMLMREPGVYEYGKKAFPGNGTSGRVDPIAALRTLDVWI